MEFAKIFAVILLHLSVNYLVTATKQCLYYDDTECLPPKSCNKTMQCDASNSGNCFSTWRNDSGSITMLKQGCWNEKGCSSLSECIGELHLDVYFCCCSGDFCNKNVSNVTTIRTTVHPGTLNPNPGGNGDSKSKLPKFVLYYILVPVFGCIVMVAVLIFLWKRHKKNVMREQPLLEQMQQIPSDDRYPHSVNLIEQVARGQFGCVWKGESVGRMVAVKIISPQDKNSWVTERNMYTVYNICHDYVLKFIGSDCRNGEYLGLEYWLITEFHQNGSLTQYLTNNSVSRNQLLDMCITMVEGLAYLHSDASMNSVVKPVIAHRDFKSKNVLVKSDLTCCVSDLGLAIAFENEGSNEEAHSQVGTNRYMAPEVLEGAITFHRESFLMIDIYALALVFWEVLSRLKINEEEPGIYRSPFHAELGDHPSIADMQDIVVERRMRPKIEQKWRSYQGILSLCETIEDCWDQDADARLTAHCVHERLLQIKDPNQSKTMFVSITNTMDDATQDEQRSSSGVSSCSLTDGRDSTC